ncbi:Kinesin light chain [Madurella mycetomatis]|uniref:Kinesin light chain n=1 Tax=Madurella mycetomatis TaxID=100816 RepID=A0A175VWP7_9PEZI|nr:Kinesin light chain [Madurella mycetomatis]
MPAGAVRLLALDGGGVRGLSSLMILRRLMEAVDPNAPPRPSDYFDMIGGTSTGGLIAIMLGRLRMTVDECIDAYTSLSDKVFEKKSHRINIKGKLQGRFDTDELEQAVKQILAARGLGEDALLKDSDFSCKVFVCATSKETGDTVCLTSYRSPRSDNSDLLNFTKIWQACRATSAATTFFDPIAIGPFGEEFVDGALGANNPIHALWNQAQDVWGDQLRGSLQCIVSIGTGVPALKPVRDDVRGIWATLRELATETEKTAEHFRRDKPDLDDEGRYYRFNVDRGLEEIGLEESKKKNEIAAATRRYVESQAVFKQIKACANAITRREYFGPYRTVFALHGAPTSNHFVDRQFDTDDLERCLLPRSRSLRTQQQIFVLYGLGGIGKTQLAADFARRHKATFSSVFWLDGRSEDNLRKSFAGYASKIPKGQIPDRSRDVVPTTNDDVNVVVADVLDWLARPDNADWLLIFDNVDQDVDQGGETGVYNIRRYLPGDHGSVLITTRLARLAQLGDSRRLTKVDEELGKAIFQRWFRRELVMDEIGKELLSLLDGLPLALAQAASYLRETELDAATYVRLYKQQWDELMRSDGEAGSPLVEYEQRSIGTTWTISFEAIRARNENAANLLRLWAFMDNKDFWHGLLQTAVNGGDEWPKWLCGLASSEVKFLDAVRLALRYSMIEAEESVRGSYMMHPVVHRWALHMQTRDEKEGFFQLAVVLIGELVPSNTVKDYWVLQRRLLPHAERVSWWMGQMYGAGRGLEDASAISAIHDLGSLYVDQGRVQEAEAMYQQALQGKERALGPDHTSTLDTINNLGCLYRNQGRLQEAEAIYQRALQGTGKALGPDHTSTLSTINNLGCLYIDQGRRAGSREAMYQRALQGIEKALGPDHTSALDIINNLGSLYRNQGRLRGGRGDISTGTARSYSTLDTINTLGSLYRNQSRLQEAEAMYQRALQGIEKALGLNHTSTVKTIYNFGSLYIHQGRLQEAEAIWASTELRAGCGRQRQCISGLFLDTKRLDGASLVIRVYLAGHTIFIAPNMSSIPIQHSLVAY